MGENIWKQSDQQGTNFQNTQTANLAQCQRNKQPIKKVGRRPKQTFLQRRYTDGAEGHEKMLSTANTREMQIKTTVRYHLTLLKTAIKESTKSNAGEGVGI